jgi:hypothetical protein
LLSRFNDAFRLGGVIDQLDVPFRLPLLVMPAQAGMQ